MTLLKKYPALRNGWFIAATVLFVVDRLCKYWSLQGHSYYRGSAVAFWAFRNTGIAFSLPLAAKIFWPAALVIFAVLIFFFVKSFSAGAARAGLYWLVLLGALSNLIDRATLGATSDYLIFFNRSAVNIADGMIILGLLILCFGKSDNRVSSSEPTGTGL